MKIDCDTIKYIADLAMIEITESEEKEYSKHLEQILTYAEILDNMDTSMAVQFKNPNCNENRFRKDEIVKPLDRELVLKNAPETSCGMFKVPKVVQ